VIRRLGVVVLLAGSASGCTPSPRSVTAPAMAVADAPAAEAAACQRYAESVSRSDVGQAWKDTNGGGMRWLINPSTGGFSLVGAAIMAGTRVTLFTARTITDYAGRPSAADAYRACMSRQSETD
jgi:hypothetical protein